LKIKLPHEQAANSFIRDSTNLKEFKYYFTRKLVFIKESHSTVLVPGGFGAIDLSFEKLTLFQTGKCMPRPIVLLDHKEDNYWDRWLDLLDSLLLKTALHLLKDLLFIKRAHNDE
jgi:predicted Rossmann-fold nucleotide-binding protein